MLPFAGDPLLHLLDRPLLGHPGDGSLPALPHPGVDNPSPFFPLSPPLFDHELLNDLSLLALPPQISPPSSQHPAPSSRPAGDASCHKGAVAPPPRRVVSGCCLKDDGTARGAAPAAKGTLGDHGGCGAGVRRLRKDRHSKINTSQGLRDRRMRLSLDVARKFFDLQDMLGFDKASKTVDWLLTSSKSSILEITGCSSSFPAYPADAGPPAGHAKSESSTTECEGAISTGKHPAAAVSALEKKTSAARRTRRTSAHPTPPSRESRQMARARARERTKEKRMQKGGGSEGCQQKTELESSSSPLNALGEESGTYTLESSGLVAKHGRPAPCISLGQCNKSSSNSPSMANNGGHGPIPILDYDQNTVLVEGDTAIFIQEQCWEAQTPGNLEEQRINLADAQLQPWIWELAFNS